MPTDEAVRLIARLRRSGADVYLDRHGQPRVKGKGKVSKAMLDALARCREDVIGILAVPAQPTMPEALPNVPPVTADEEAAVCRQLEEYFLMPEGGMKLYDREEFLALEGEE